MESSGAVTYKLFKSRHKEYRADYWKRCEVLYAGGQRLLESDAFQEIFPKHLNEEEWVYKERVKRAFYLPYAGGMIDFIAANLGTHPLQMTTPGAKTDGAAVDAFWESFFADVSRPGGEEMSLTQLAVETIRTALIKGVAWSLVDLPPRPAEAPKTEAEEESMGLRRAYAMPLDPEAVVDWHIRPDGEIAWARVRDCTCERLSPFDEHRTVTEIFTDYAMAGRADGTPGPAWRRYTFVYKEGETPKDDAAPSLMEAGELSFDKVPLVRLELPDGLWAMGKLESIAREHLNKNCALSWAEYRTAFAFLAVFLAADDPKNGSRPDAKRGTKQKVGPGRAWVGTAEDRLEYIGPDPGAFEAMQNRLNNLRDEMHRVMHQMAMSVDNSAAALQRSGESKQLDAAATCVVLGALGKFGRGHSERVVALAQTGRKDAPAKFTATGMDNFDETTLAALLEEQAALETISIPSPTYQRMRKMRIVRRDLGDEVDEKTLGVIEKELEHNITAEQYDQPTPREKFEAESKKPTPDDDDFGG